MQYDTRPAATQIAGILDAMPYPARIPVLIYLHQRALAQAPPPIIDVIEAGGGTGGGRAPITEAPQPEEAPGPPAEILERVGVLTWLNARFEAQLAAATKEDGAEGIDVSLTPRMHKEAAEAAEIEGWETGCPTTNKEGAPATCRGTFANCGVKLGMRVLAAQSDYPMTVLRERAGPWGDLYRFGKDEDDE